MNTLENTRSRVYTGSSLRDLIERRTGDRELARTAALVATVLPFKVNTHVVDELVDWATAPDDPMYRLLFPHRDMLTPAEFDLLDRAAADPARLREVVSGIRAGMNPHPADQLELNMPVWGLQHKYPRTLLVFPKQGQTCHSYCGYCFRWAQFIGEPDLRMAVAGPETMTSYLDRQPSVVDVVLTGGDPLVMRTPLLERYIRPLLEPRYEHVESIRIGTKAVSFQPDRFTAGADADALLRLLDDVTLAGKQFALMLHVSHPRELRTTGARQALARLRASGAILRSQAPVIRHVNDDPGTWSELWREQVRHGVMPYYLFVERDTGANHYFGLPLTRVLDIYREAVAAVGGLARTARGPVMSISPGKVVVDGIAELPGGRAFALRFLQARDAGLIGRPFHARYRPDAAGWADLEPYGPADQEFFRAPRRSV